MMDAVVPPVAPPDSLLLSPLSESECPPDASARGSASISCASCLCIILVVTSLRRTRYTVRYTSTSALQSSTLDLFTNWKWIGVSVYHLGGDQLVSDSVHRAVHLHQGFAVFNIGSVNELKWNRNHSLSFWWWPACAWLGTPCGTPPQALCSLPHWTCLRNEIE